MSGIIDGRYDDADGRSRIYVRRRDGESDEDFAGRAVNIMFVMSDLLPIEQVVTSRADLWTKLPSTRWLEARLSTDPTIHVRVTDLPSAGCGSVGHLVVDHGGQQVADEWGDRQENGAYLPRADQGRVTRWSATLWRLAHEIRGIGDHYDAALARSGLIVESW
jgi:hypothetical protein